MWNEVQYRTSSLLHRHLSQPLPSVPYRYLQQALRLLKAAPPDAACWIPSAHGLHRRFQGMGSALLQQRTPSSGKRPCNRTLPSDIRMSHPYNVRIRSYVQNVPLRPKPRSPVLHDSYLPHPQSCKQPRRLHAGWPDRTYQSYDKEPQQSHIH